MSGAPEPAGTLRHLWRGLVGTALILCGLLLGLGAVASLVTAGDHRVAALVLAFLLGFLAVVAMRSGVRRLRPAPAVTTAAAPEAPAATPASRLRSALMVVLVAVLPATCLYRDHQAATAAQAFCAAIRTGDPLTTVDAAVAGAAGNPRRMAMDQRVVVEYTGVVPFSRHACVMELDGGNVSEVRYVHVD